MVLKRREVIDARDDLEDQTNDRSMFLAGGTQGKNSFYENKDQVVSYDDDLSPGTNISSTNEQPSTAQSSQIHHQSGDSVIESFWDALLNGCIKSPHSCRDGAVAPLVRGQ